MNQVNLIGRLGRDPEQKSYDGGVLCRFSVAVDRRSRGEKETDWFNVTAFGKTAELCLEYIGKGRQVAIEGRLQTRSWEADDGTKRYATDVIANRVHFLGSKNDSESSGGVGYQSQAKPKAPAYDDDDMPF